ncbi:hypothetical protein GMMP13_1320016 [Candidatus Magnetomoraceae bacterium gMMP-13]
MINLEEFKKYKILKGLNSDVIVIVLWGSEALSFGVGWGWVGWGGGGGVGVGGGVLLWFFCVLVVGFFCLVGVSLRTPTF